MTPRSSARSRWLWTPPMPGPVPHQELTAAIRSPFLPSQLAKGYRHETTLQDHRSFARRGAAGRCLLIQLIQLIQLVVEGVGPERDSDPRQRERRNVGLRLQPVQPVLRKLLGRQHL